MNTPRRTLLKTAAAAAAVAATGFPAFAQGRTKVKVGYLHTPAVDAQTRSAMQDLLLQVLEAEGKTVMLITHSVDEAIYLSSRIVVVTARPARIREVVELPFGYPRSEKLHEDPRFVELRSHIRDLVMQEYEAQARQTVRLSD